MSVCPVPFTRTVSRAVHSAHTVCTTLRAHSFPVLGIVLSQFVAEFPSVIYGGVSLSLSME